MKYLVVGPSWVGDMVISQVVYMLIKQQYPSAIIDILAPAWSIGIIERMPEIRRGINMPHGHGVLQLGNRRRIGQSLRSCKYTNGIVLPNSFKSALIPWWANIPIRTGWHGEVRYGLLNDRRRLDKKKLPRMVDRYAALAYPDGQLESTLIVPRLHVTEIQKKCVIDKYKVNCDVPILGLCPGSEFGLSKRWPPEYYSEVAQAMLSQGWQVCIFGSSTESYIAESIINKIPLLLQKHCYNWVGKTTLSDAIDLMSLTSLVLSNDSGLMHIAAALDRIVVGLFGSTSEDHTPPLNAHSKSIWLSLDCSPCFQRECPLKHHNCMKKLNVDKVLDVMTGLINNKNGGS